MGDDGSRKGKESVCGRPMCVCQKTVRNEAEEMGGWGLTTLEMAEMGGSWGYMDYDGGRRRRDQCFGQGGTARLTD